MRTGSWKRTVVSLIPYVIIGLLASKVGAAIRLSWGTESRKWMFSFMEHLSGAFRSSLPSFHPFDLAFGAACAALLRLAVSTKAKNAKKYRRNMEYGSARWGTRKDIEPFMDPKFENNIILTATERLTMNSRPKSPALARNKNMLVVGDNVIIGLSPSDFRKRGSHGGLVHICLRR